MAFNPDPTKQATEILFSCKRKEINHPPLFFNGHPVKRVLDHQHLGLILEPSLSFNKHVNEKISKANKNVGLIKHLNRYLPYRALNQMYNALVRSHLDYCDIIFLLPEIFKPPLLGTHLDRTNGKTGKSAIPCWVGSLRCFERN